MKLRALSILAIALMLTVGAVYAEVEETDQDERHQVRDDTATGKIIRISTHKGETTSVTIRLSETRTWKVTNGWYPDLQRNLEFFKEAKRDGDFVTLVVEGGELIDVDRGSEPKPE
jgi:hypothetical protein